MGVRKVGKIIIFPSPEKEETCKKPASAKSAILESLKQLAWDDPESFIALEALCSFSKQAEVSPKVKEKLYKLHLLDDTGNPLLIVQTIMQDITKDPEDTVILCN